MTMHVGKFLSQDARDEDDVQPHLHPGFAGLDPIERQRQDL